MTSSKLLAALGAVAASLVLLTPVVRGERPTRAAIVAYSAECQQAGHAMDLIARFGTDFSGLNLSGVDLRGMHRVGLETNLRGADFSNANLQGAQFGAAILEAADFTGANLDNGSFVTARLQHAILHKASFQRTNFRECNLDHAQLAGVDLSQANLSGSRFSHADLAGATLSGAAREYRGIDFQGANLTGADLHGLMLDFARFQNANLRAANLSDCRLEQADFTGADLTNAVLDRAYVRAARFQDARGLQDDNRRRLLAEARRWQFELKSTITSFLDSARFPICLLFVVPLVAWTVRALRRRLQRSPARPLDAPRYQFSLFHLLNIMLGVGLLFGIATWSAHAAFWFMMVCAGYMMVAEVVLGRTSRLWAAGVLVLALGYAAANAGLYYYIYQIANHYISVFAPLFMLAVIILGPLLTIVVVATTVVAQPALRAKPPWAGLAGLAIWMISVGMANCYVIAMASASV